jgi:flagellar motility protein MotE (MotC chaperone)
MQLKTQISARRPAPPRSKGSRRRGLFLVALFFGLSGALRLGEGIAQTVTGAPPPAAKEAAANSEPDAGTMALLEALRTREARLAEQEARAASDAQTLAVARSEIDRRIAALEAAEQKLAATIAVADQAAEKDVARLVAVYESMKPKDAARLFGEMEPDFAAGFLARMRPEAAAAVMTGLDPARAYAISVVLAGRNANGPKS